MPFVINGTTGINLGTQPLTGSLPDANAPSGSVLQVVSATKSDTASFTSSTFADVTGLSVSITPISSSSKILVFSTVNVAWQQAVTKAGYRIMRDSTPIGVGDSAGSRPRVSGAAYIDTPNYTPEGLSMNHLDSPATTSAVTYKIQMCSIDNSGTVYINRAFGDPDQTIVPRTASSITVMEIAG